MISIHSHLGLCSKHVESSDLQDSLVQDVLPLYVPSIPCRNAFGEVGFQRNGAWLRSVDVDTGDGEDHLGICRASDEV